MRKVLILAILPLLMFGCKKESRLDKIEAEHELQKHQKDRQPTESQELGVSENQSVPQRGFDAYKDMKEVRSEEHARQEEEQKTMDEIDNNQ
jgi:hypothetical protein